MEHTVEIVVAPVVNDDWALLRRVTDVMPGTLLIEDAEEPMFVIPIEAQTNQNAAIFVQGVLSDLGLKIIWGRSYRTEHSTDDFGTAEDANDAVADFRLSWLEPLEQTRQARQLVSC